MEADNVVTTIFLIILSVIVLLLNKAQDKQIEKLQDDVKALQSWTETLDDRTRE